MDRLKAQINIGGSATGANVAIETTRENLPAALRLAGEILREPSFPESEFEQIRKEYLTNLEYSKSEPQQLAMTEVQRAIYPFPRGDVRATMSIDEEIEDLKAAKLSDAKAFYEKFYGASHGELAVVGDFDPAELKKAAGELFGTWKNPAKFERIKTGYAKIAPVSKTIQTPDKANAMFVAAERVNLSDQDADYPGLLFGNYMLGGGFLNSRFATRIRVKDGLSYGVNSVVSAKSDEKDGRFLAYAIANPQNVAKVETAFHEELARALKDGFTDKEIADDRDGWLQSRTLQRADDRSLAGVLASRDYDSRTLLWDEDLEKKVAALKPEDIVGAMRRNIDPAQISIVKAGDFAKAAAK